MSFKISKLVVGKGRTISNEEQKEWTRQYYEVEAIVEDGRQIQLAKDGIETLLNMWLKGESLSTEQPKREWNPDAIRWEKVKGSREIERSEDVNSLDFKALWKDLAEHGSKLTREGWFYWVYKNGSTVGKKKRG